MNPLLRWVTKIIQIFRPKPAPVVATEVHSFQRVEPEPRMEIPSRIERPEAHDPEPVKEPEPAQTVVLKETAPVQVEKIPQSEPVSEPTVIEVEERTYPSTSLRSAPDDEPLKVEAAPEPVVTIPEKLAPEPVATPAPVVQEEKLPPKKSAEKLASSAAARTANTSDAGLPVESKPVAVAEPKQETKPIFTGRVEITPDLDNPARLRQIKGVISVNDIANRELLDLVPYEPGKPVDDVAREIGLDPASIIKLASNENPLGPSPLAMAAMHKAIETSHFYPDGGGFHLRNAIAHAFGLGRENVVLGNGSNEIIELLFHTFTRPGIHEIITARHAFAVYTLMAQLFGVHAIVVDDVDFTPDLPAMLKAVTPQTRLIFLASPNNPTGSRVTNEALNAFIRDLPPQVIAVLDEAYYEFLDNPPDSIGYVKNGARVVLMRTFSKIQGLAGLRVGYGLAPAEIANLLQRARQPFNANSIAQAGAMAGLADLEHQKKTKAITDEGRRVIEEAFTKMGLKYVPSSANFVMVNVGDGGEVFKRLMKKGIIVRSMVSYHLPAYIRVSVGTSEQNTRFLAELPDALEGLVSFTRP
jgi:histidinol-phosphate aminotransferase